MSHKWEGLCAAIDTVMEDIEARVIKRPEEVLTALFGGGEGAPFDYTAPPCDAEGVPLPCIETYDQGAHAAVRAALPEALHYMLPKRVPSMKTRGATSHSAFTALDSSVPGF